MEANLSKQDKRGACLQIHQLHEEVAARLYLSVSALEEGDAQQDALLKHPVILGVDDEVDHQLRRPDVVEEALDLHHGAHWPVRVQHGGTSCRDVKKHG